MVALTRLAGLVEPKLLVRMSWMPAASQTARTAAPAITPVPGLAGTSIDVGRAEAPFDRVRNGARLDRESRHAAGAVLDGLFDAGRHFVGLAVAPADLALAVADDDHGGEAEPPAAFDHGGAALDLDRPCRSIRRHDSESFATMLDTRLGTRGLAPECSMRHLKLQTGFAGGFGQGGHAAVELVLAAVEARPSDAGRQRLARRSPCPPPRRPPCCRRISLRRAIACRSCWRHQGAALRVVDHLGVNMLVAAEDRQPRALGRPWTRLRTRKLRRSRCRCDGLFVIHGTFAIRWTERSVLRCQRCETATTVLAYFGHRLAGLAADLLRRRSGCPCLCTARACARPAPRRQTGRPFACRFP